MKHLYLLFALFFSAQNIHAQYLESFDIPIKGILLCPTCGTSTQCGSNDPTSCTNHDFTGVNWTIGGNLSLVDQEGIPTSNGELVFSDMDELVCWISPPIDISAVASSSLNLSITFSGTWSASDFGQVIYAVDGGAQTIIPNVTGCGGANTFGGCAFPDGNYTPSASGIIGNEMTIQVCLDANAAGEIGRLEFVSVPEAGTVVPVTWNRFTAKTMDDGNLLEWSTESELNNDRFEIERSVDNASDFQVISRQDGAGNSSEEKFYSFLDEDVTPGTVYYYRIKQVDLDGKKSFSRLLSLQSANNVSFSISPNPFSHQITIDLSSDENQNKPKSFKLYNAQGVMIQEINTGTARQISVDMQEQAPGIYYISADNKDFKKIVKSH